VGGAISDNSTATGSAGQFLSAGAGGEVIWSTIPGGSGIAAVNAGTNISIPDPGVPVVSVAISSDLDMNGYDVYNASNLTLRSDTGLLKIRSEGVGGGAGVAIQTTSAPIVLSTNNEIQLSADGNIGIETSTGLVSISNPTLGNGGAQLNVNGSASIRGDTAQLQVLDGAGVQKGVLSYNSLDGQTHLDGTDLVVSAGESIEITAIQSVNINCNETDGVVNVKANGQAGIVNIEAIGDDGSLNLNGRSVNMSSTVDNVTISANVNLSLSGIDSASLTATSGSVNVTANDGVSIASVSSGNVSISAYEALGISTVNNSISITSASDTTIACGNGGVLSVGGANTSEVNISVADVGTVAINGDTISIAGGNLTATMGGGLSLNTSGALSLSADDPITISTNGNTDTINITSASELTLSSVNDTYITVGGGIITDSGSVSMTTTGGNISLHSNGGTLVLASANDAVSISSGGGDLASITGGSGGVFLNTGGELYLNGASIVDTSAGGSSGNYLVVRINGDVYRIDLLKSP
jgi:hypothetical protein